ncbi:MAG TPA: hypothetical protein VHX42_00200 [Candidatus Babeliales bacterium]|jgi:hypothetical protein|nr:hypothetical protein [Candidatus Babeliales bacterium]
MTTKQTLFSALILGAISNIALTTQETSTNSRHKILNNIPVFTKIGDGMFLIEDSSQVAYTNAHYPDAADKFRKLFENGLNGVLCNDECFLIVNSNQQNDCDLVINKQNTLLRKAKQAFDYLKKEIHDSEKKLTAETNNVKKQEISEYLIYCNKSYDETKGRIEELEKRINVMNGTKK